MVYISVRYLSHWFKWCRQSFKFVIIIPVGSVYLSQFIRIRQYLKIHWTLFIVLIQITLLVIYAFPTENGKFSASTRPVITGITFYNASYNLALFHTFVAALMDSLNRLPKSIEKLPVQYSCIVCISYHRRWWY